MIELLAAFALGAAPFGAAFFFAQREWARERGHLLDRLMARDWTEYRLAVSAPPSRPAVLQVVDDETEARYAEEHGLTVRP